MRILSNKIKDYIGKEIEVAGWVHKIRKLGGITFIIIRDRNGFVQAVVDKETKNIKIQDLKPESVVKITGKLSKDKRAPGGAELRISKIEILSKVKEDIPIEISKKDLGVNLDTLLDYRPITLRNQKQKTIFKISAKVCNVFQEFFDKNDFVEIHTPKIVSQGAEGGAQLFPVKYFGKKAFLTQSPQFYKQIMVGIYERVFEIAPVYRAEEHNTRRHLNEYISLDIEMGFIKNMKDIMEILTEFLKFALPKIKKDCKEELDILGVKIPTIPKEIPKLKLTEAQKILEKEYKERCLGAPDLDPKQEKLISEYADKKFKTKFVFITHYPSKKRPFYVMDDPNDSKYTESFDLIFDYEIVTGGQRIHQYQEYLEKMKRFNLNPKDFDFYLSAFKYGMPPHGGFAIGLERLVAKLLDLDNIREACLFPRDITRLIP
ncbi:MAG: aspartate--tRNA(Asn) ligase [Candidatus Aenigmarchaeota archaeon]|nr:aspartate--tRNA(Asn) ligase [Candidatus Aenigmarchaeota archaeon]